MKSFTSRHLRKAISQHIGESRREWIVWMMNRAGSKNGNNNDWQLRQQHNKPLEILSANMFYQKLAYIHMNPVESGFVDKAEEYLYGSVRDFYGKNGLKQLNYIV